MWTTVPRPDQVDEPDRFFELGHRDRNLCDLAKGGARIEGLRNPMRLRSLREVMRHDDRRSMIRCEAAKRPEVFAVRFQLEIDICEARTANLPENRRALRRIHARCAPLAPRSKRRNGPSADAVRQLADCRRSQVSDIVESQLDEVCAFPEGNPGLAFRLARVVRPDDRCDLRHLIAPQSSRESASRNGGLLPRAAGALRPRASPR